MSILPVVTYNDPILREKAAPVEAMDNRVRTLIDDMIETMYHSQGVGLAAPQIGESLQIFVTNSDPMTEDLDDEQDVGEFVFINPEILSLGGDDIRVEEGCLSLPTLRDDVTRPDEVHIRYLDRDMNPRELKASGWFSRVIQHEYDHLQGVLFIDHLSMFKRRLHRSLLRKIDAGNVKMDYPLKPRTETSAEGANAATQTVENSHTVAKSHTVENSHTGDAG